MNKKNTARWFGFFLAVMYGSLITNTVYKFLPGIHIAFIVLVFLGLGVGFYFLGIWILVERPAEINEKYPVSRKELRRQKKEFYESLDHQDRHQ